MFRGYSHQVLLSLSLAMCCLAAFPQKGQTQDNVSTCEPSVSNAIVEQVLQKQASYPGVYYQVGQYYSCQSKFPEAIAAYQNAIAADPKFAHAYLALGQIYADQQNWDQAVSAYQMVIELDSTIGEVYPRLAHVYTQLNRPQEAQLTLEKSLPILVNQWIDARYSDPGYLEAQPYLQEGIQLLSQGELSAAEPRLRKAISLNPSNAEAAFALSHLFVKQNKLDAALNGVTQTYQYIVRRADREQIALPAETSYLSYSNTAQYFSTKGDFETAIAILKKLIPLIDQEYQSLLLRSASKEDNATLLNLNVLRGGIPLQLGSFLAQQGRPEEALKQFRAAIQNSEFPLTITEFLQQIADAANNKQPDPNAALKTENGVEAKAYQYLGNAYLSLNRMPEAISSYQRGLELVPDMTALLSSLGLAHLKSDQIPEALILYRKIAALVSTSKTEDVDSADVEFQATRIAARELLRLQKFESVTTLLQADLTQAMPPEQKSQHQLLLARAYILNQQYDVASRFVASMISATPVSGRIALYSELVNLYIKQEQYLQAETTAEAMIKAFPDQELGYWTLATVYGHLQKPKLAVSTYLKLNSAKPVEQEIQTYLRIGQQLQTEGNYPAALLLYRQLRERAQEANKAETDYLAQYRIAKIYLSQEQYDSATPLLMNLLEVSQTRTAPFVFQDQFQAALAKLYTYQGHYAQALSAFRQSTRLVSVVSQFDQGIPRTSEDVIAYSSLGRELIDLKRPELALEVLDLAVLLQPDVSMPRQLRGMLYENQGKLMLAANDYESAIAAIPDTFKQQPSQSFSLRLIHPSLSNLYLRWGRILMEQNNSAEAIVKFQQALQANEKNVDAQRLLEDAIAQIEGDTPSSQPVP